MVVISIVVIVAHRSRCRRQCNGFVGTYSYGTFIGIYLPIQSENEIQRN